MFRKRLPFHEAKEWPSQPNFFDYNYGIRGGNQYFTPYLQLLLYCFDIVNNPYAISPFHLPQDYVIEAPRHLDGQHSLDFLAVYNVRAEIIMFAQIVDKEMEMTLMDKRPEPFRDNIYLLADKQMRAMYKYLLGTRPIHTLWGLSFINKSLRVYSGDNETGKVTPTDVEAPSELDWNIDILSPAGFETMKNIVQDVKKNDKAVPFPFEEWPEDIRELYKGGDICY